MVSQELVRNPLFSVPSTVGQVKILYLITWTGRGGAQIHVRDLLANLPAQFKPVLVTGEAGFLCEEATRLGVRVCVVPDLVQPVCPLKDLQALFAILRLIREENPDIIHAHTSKAGLLGRLAASLTGTPTVFTVHTWSFSPTSSTARKRLFILAERLAATVSGQIIAVSQANADLAVRWKIAHPRNLIRIWNGVPDTPFRANVGDREVRTLIMTARFVPQKAHLLLLQALAEVKGRWQLLLVGEGPMRPRVEETARRLNLSDRVKFLGDRDDIPNLLATADVFVLASEWEGFPLSILEAFRAGLPVIATDVGGVAEAVTDGVTGYLIRRNNIAELRDRLQCLVTSRELLTSMGRLARCRYEQDFRLDVMMRKTLAVYDDVLARKSYVLAASVDSAKSS